jgi:GT2 family glycosyltransferase
MSEKRLESGRGPPIVVAIPVRNEAEHIRACLAALAVQNYQADFEVVLLLNNCADATAQIVDAARRDLPFTMHIKSCTLPAAFASAGHARRLAMEAAATRAGIGGVLMTTDADSRVAHDWIASNLAALAGGADAVAGQAVIDPADAAALPHSLLAEEERVGMLATKLDEIASLLDPDPADPWPRHVQHSGASIAVMAETFHLAGGMPAVSLGEDRAFFAALRKVDARIRHCPETWVTVSGRIHGRAAGGMADTIRRRLSRPDDWLDDCLEPTFDAAIRVAARASARETWRAGGKPVGRLDGILGVAPSVVRGCLRAPRFGIAWQQLEKLSFRLQRRPIRAANLAEEIRTADLLLEQLRSLPVAMRINSVLDAMTTSNAA